MSISRVKAGSVDMQVKAYIWVSNVATVVQGRHASDKAQHAQNGGRGDGGRGGPSVDKRDATDGRTAGSPTSGRVSRTNGSD